MSQFLSLCVNESHFPRGRHYPLPPNRHAVKRPYFLRCEYSTQTNMSGGCYLACTERTGVSSMYRNVRQNSKVCSTASVTSPYSFGAKYKVGHSLEKQITFFFFFFFLVFYRAGNNWWWVPVVAPMLGGVLGAMIYIVLIEIHHSDTQPVEENDVHGKYELTNME